MEAESELGGAFQLFCRRRGDETGGKGKNRESEREHSITPADGFHMLFYISLRWTCNAVVMRIPLI